MSCQVGFLSFLHIVYTLKHNIVTSGTSGPLYKSAAVQRTRQHKVQTYCICVKTKSAKILLIQSSNHASKKILKQ